MRCYIFDLDGTLFDVTHRLHHIRKTPKDWRAFYAACVDDPPIPHMVALALDLSRCNHLVFVTGRSDEVRQETHDKLCDLDLIGHLFMRKEGDHRQDAIIKEEILAELKAQGYEPIMAFDDRNQSVAAWRRLGVPCAQVDYGDF